MNYKIEVTEEQLRLLQHATEFASRFICGQVETSYWPDVALEGPAQRKIDGGNVSTWCDMRDKIDDLMGQVKQIGWKMPRGGSYGVGYTPYTDNLWDLSQVFRHRLYTDAPGGKSAMHVAGDTPIKWGDQPLAKIEKL